MRIFPPLALALGLFSLLIWIQRAPTTAHAQSGDTTNSTTIIQSTTLSPTIGAAAAHSLYLPLIQRGVGQPTPTIKSRSGIHLGNRFDSDWRIELFEHITGTTGTWPAAVVVRSDQIFTLKRETTGICRITEAILKLTGEGEPYNAFKYLDAAIKAGTKVVIRIAPSPGNFVDYQAPGGNHTLLIDETPAGGNYCDESATGGLSKGAKLDAFRDIRNIAEEMSAIYTLTVGMHEWPAELLYFEPANEPNKEWYIDQGVVNPNADNKNAWIAMDEYFAALYDLATSMEPDLQILSPSLSQDLFGQNYLLGSCTGVSVVGGDGLSGVEFMTKTFGVDLTGNLVAPKADGFAIHNYWREGKEVWLAPYFPTAIPVAHLYCQAHRDYPEPYTPNTHHLLQYLSAPLMQAMTRLPTFITEADLLSNCQDGGNPLQYKDRSVEDPYNPERTRQSLLTFTNQANGRSQTTPTEYGAQYVIVWLLINQEPNEETYCATNYEQNWHEAYWEDENRVYEREWFPLWWAAAQ
ncbi:MAG: hypothetical protein R3A44_14865 [Caldilineaceae bacterium]